MRGFWVFSLGVLASCQLTASIGSAEVRDSETGTGAGPVGTGTGAGPVDTGTSTGPVDTDSGSSAGGAPETSGDSSGMDPGGACSQYTSPGSCFDVGCVWDFRRNHCETFDPSKACKLKTEDGMCLSCLKISCCPTLQACHHDRDCSCFEKCLEQNDDVLRCQGSCKPSDAAGYVGMCAGNACFESCG